MSRRDVVVAGGGTAGHVVPSLEVARALVARGHPAERIVLVGARRGRDRSIFEGHGFPVVVLSGRGLSRRIGIGPAVRNVAALLAIGWACARTLVAFVRWRPHVAVSLGGYASVPVGVAAAVLGVPLVLVTVDAVPGLAQRALGRFAAASAVAFPGTPLPRAVVTGTPVSQAVRSTERTPEARDVAAAALGLPPGRTTVAAVGGSLGSRRINAAIGALAETWAGRSDVAVYHVTGHRDWEEFGDGSPLSARPTGGSPTGEPGPPQGPEGLCYVRVPFEEHMERVYSAADLVVCRAGGMTVAELAVCGVPSVLVPLPGAPGDHQTANAAALVEAGAAVMVPDGACDGPRLATVVGELLADPARRERMAAAAAALGHPDAASRVAEVVDSHAR